MSDCVTFFKANDILICEANDICKVIFVLYFIFFNDGIIFIVCSFCR